MRGALCIRVQRLRVFCTESSHGSRGPRPPGKAPLAVNDPHEEFGHLWDSSEPGNVFFQGLHTGETVISVAFGSLDKSPAMSLDGGFLGFLVGVEEAGADRGVSSFSSSTCTLSSARASSFCPVGLQRAP